MKLPTKVFVYVYKDGNYESLIAEVTAKACAAKDEKRLIGMYELKEIFRVTLEVKKEDA